MSNIDIQIIWVLLAGIVGVALFFAYLGRKSDPDGGKPKDHRSHTD